VSKWHSVSDRSSLQRSTDEFERWWNDLSEDEQDSVDQNRQTSTDAWSFTRKTTRRPHSILAALDFSKEAFLGGDLFNWNSDE